MTQKRIFEFGGYIAAAILIAFGVASIVMGVNGPTRSARTSSASSSSGHPT